MDITFISMHDLSPEAKLVYASDSISDVLGYEPHEVIGDSLFAYFHPEEISIAQTFHGRGVEMDKAAVLAYCRLRSKAGDYVCCEIVFTVVYSVVVAATSIYRQTNKSHERALTAPYIRRAFSSSQRDPRYHMLAHLSPKFNTIQAGQHEPRSCLILNRFTRALTILYATNILRDILGFPPHQAVGLSFFEFISQDCLQDAVEVLDRAKENDSIAYLRFFARDPRVAEAGLHGNDEIRDRRQRRSSLPTSRNRGVGGSRHAETPDPRLEFERGEDANGNDSVMTGNVEDRVVGGGDDTDGNYEERVHYPSNPHSIPRMGLPNRVSDAARGPEVEAVVSCTSDGLVVVLRRARPVIPLPDPQAGFFASPWARSPYQPMHQPLGNGPGGPAPADFMDSIRQVAVFAWCLRSINENMVQFARFEPHATEPVLTPPRNQERVDRSDDSEHQMHRNDVASPEIASTSGTTSIRNHSSSRIHNSNTDNVAGYDIPPPKQQTSTYKRKRSD